MSNKPPPIGTRKQRHFRKAAYWLVYRPDHPDSPAKGWMMEHRLVMEQKISRRLFAAEVVHHIDHDGLNNDPANLELIASKGKHLADKHAAEGGRASVAARPVCACGARMDHGVDQCWSCWKNSQTCPKCGRPDRKMATRDYCHGCYKKIRVAERGYKWLNRPSAARAPEDLIGPLRGEENPVAVLTDDLVRLIRRRFDGGERVSVIARDLGLVYTTAEAAAKRQSWKHVR